MFVNSSTEKLTSFGKGKSPTSPACFPKTGLGFAFTIVLFQHTQVVGPPQKAPSGLEEIRPGFYGNHFAGERDSDSHFTI